MVIATDSWKQFNRGEENITAEERRKESEEEMKILGCQVLFLGIPDNKLTRQVLREKLKQLHFKKWQNSIWASPYALDPEIEAEFKELGEKFFIRLIKTSDINNTGDLEKLFP